MAIAGVIADFPISQFGRPVIEAEYAAFATAQDFVLPPLRVVAESSGAQWSRGRPIAYATSESGHWSVSALVWERVLREIRLLAETAPAGTTLGARARSKARESEPFRLFVEERRFVAANLERLKTMYSGRYIAVLGSSVIDFDTDFSALAGRIYQRFGYRRIFMPFVGKSRRLYRMPSPRIVR